ncbi:hypothetical protein F4808DRAFT_457546 [Astrocystis sublimbata]|nr:hypothetical protein F4808DRAFT_457546 [Astrocystis sublimbata]
MAPIRPKSEHQSPPIARYQGSELRQVEKSPGLRLAKHLTEKERRALIEKTDRLIKRRHRLDRKVLRVPEHQDIGPPLDKLLHKCESLRKREHEFLSRLTRILNLRQHSSETHADDVNLILDQLCIFKRSLGPFSNMNTTQQSIDDSRSCRMDSICSSPPPEISDLPEHSDSSELLELSEFLDLPELLDSSDLSELSEFSELSELSESSEVSELSKEIIDSQDKSPAKNAVANDSSSTQADREKRKRGQNSSEATPVKRVRFKILPSQESNVDNTGKGTQISVSNVNGQEQAPVETAKTNIR